MSNGADRFFDEMLETAKIAAKKDVKQEMSSLKKQLAQTKRELATFKKGARSVATRTTKVEQRESKVKQREKEVALAEKEIVYLFDKFEEIGSDMVEERVYVNTRKVRTHIPRSTMHRGWGYSKFPTPKSRALTTIAKRIRAAQKKGTK